jgi:hypothetical protein
MMRDAREVLEICKRTIGQYGLTEVAKMLIEEGHWADSCRAAIVPFMECAETALPELAQRVIEMEKENAKLRAVAEAGKTSLRHCLPEPNEDEEYVVCDGYPDACPQCDAGKLREALIALTAAGYGGEE